MSSVYKVETYIGEKKTTTPELFKREIHAVAFAFDRAIDHADGNASNVNEVYKPSPGDSLPYRFHAQQWVDPIVGDGPVKGDLLQVVVTRVGVHDDPVSLPA